MYNYNEEEDEENSRTAEKIRIVLIVGASWMIIGICIMILVFINIIGK